MNIFNEKQKNITISINYRKQKKKTNQPRATTKCDNGIQRKLKQKKKNHQTNSVKRKQQTNKLNLHIICASVELSKDKIFPPTFSPIFCCYKCLFFTCHAEKVFILVIVRKCVGTRAQQNNNNTPLQQEITGGKGDIFSVGQQTKKNVTFKMSSTIQHLHANKQKRKHAKLFGQDDGGFQRILVDVKITKQLNCTALYF